LKSSYFGDNIEKNQIWSWEDAQIILLKNKHNETLCGGFIRRLFCCAQAGKARIFSQHILALRLRELGAGCAAGCGKNFPAARFYLDRRI